MRRPLTLFTAVAAASVLALAGCSGNGSAGSQSEDTASADEVGPLEVYFAALWDDEEWSQEMMDQQDLRREELIAECMAKEGFEYIPNSNTGGTLVYSDDVEGPAWDSLEFAEQYGYGVVDWPGSNEIEEIGDTEYFDPNEDYVGSLSESEQDAYYETLYGAPVEYDDSFTEMDEEVFDYNWEDNGCWGWADNEINKEDSSAAAWEDPEFEDLFLDMEELWTGIENSPDITAASAEWAACMEAAGFPGLSEPADARNLIDQRLDEIYESASTPDGEWSEPSAEALEELRIEEITLATADWKCKDQVNYFERLQKADFAAQQEFVDTHRDALEALVAKHGVDSTKNG